MLEYISLIKIRDKILLAIVCFIVFGFLYATVPKNEVNFDSSNLYDSMMYSFSVQMFRFDYNNIVGRAFIMSIIQIILSYIILVM